MDLVTAESLGVVGDPTAVVEPLVIPRTAALLTGTRAVVYVKATGTDTPTYEVREVELGPRAGDLYIVASGLREGEEVVVNGAFRIDSAMQILAKPSMMMPGGGEGGAIRGEAVGTTVPEQFVTSLGPVYAAYLGVQEALARDDFGGFVKAASDLQAAIALVEETGLVGNPLGAWRRSAAKIRLDRAVATIEDARVRFEFMSKGIIELQRRFGHLGRETWHLAYCPMAFDNRGAEWLQRGTTINNPYFGASMLRCGTVRDAFQPLNAPAAPTTRPGDSGGHEHE
jgi:Cu(I)/Ag(I) efflux system membrane fusion protein